MMGGERSCIETLTLRPIGVFRAESKYPYDVPRQGVLAGENLGRIILDAGMGYEQALEDLDGFTHIWVLFWFDRNGSWRPKIQPPRHLGRKVGVFASRSPYRPNPLGLSAVRLLEVRGREVVVAGHDLLDGTPVLDIKPYLTYADAFPDASPGWTATGGDSEYEVVLSQDVEERLAWLSERGVVCLRGFILDHLSLEPENRKLHRLVEVDGSLSLAYRTWRALFTVSERRVEVIGLRSGYTSEQLVDGEDVYGDKALHRDFKACWG